MDHEYLPPGGSVITLPDLPDAIVDKAITNLRRKLVGGYRNKDNSKPNAKSVSPKAVASDTLKATNASSVLAVSQRGLAWKEMIQKSLSQGISSLSTMKFDGEFTVKNGQPQGLKDVPNKPGVYVVYNADNKPVYVGDSKKLQKRWHADHLNHYRRGKTLGTGYKLDGPLEGGCTVRYIVMNSAATAAALEAHLIKTVDPEINARQELLTEQGKRNNIEAKKVKDASGSTMALAKGATLEAGINMTWGTLEVIADIVIIAIKNELVDILAGSKTSLNVRAERVLRKILEAVKGLVADPLKLLDGLVEFVVNALSKAIGEIYMLAHNLYDLANSAWNLHQSAETMSKEDLIKKISETILISGTLVFWDAMDPLLEMQLTALIPPLAPIAPYLAAAMAAIGFGATSYYLRNLIPALVTFLVNFRTGWHDAIDAQRALCDQMLAMFEQEIKMIGVTNQHFESSKAFIADTERQTRSLREHKPIEAFDVTAMIYELNARQNEGNSDEI